LVHNDISGTRYSRSRQVTIHSLFTGIPKWSDQ
jgi:hypothetical protein